MLVWPHEQIRHHKFYTKLVLTWGNHYKTSGNCYPWLVDTHISFQAKRRGRIFCSQGTENAVKRENINFAIRYSTMTRMTMVIITVGPPVQMVRILACICFESRMRLKPMWFSSAGPGNFRVCHLSNKHFTSHPLQFIICCQPTILTLRVCSLRHWRCC
jgi:hypothetical protein